MLGKYEEDVKDWYGYKEMSGRNGGELSSTASPSNKHLGNKKSPHKIYEDFL